MVKIKTQEVVKTNEELKNQVKEKLNKTIEQTKKQTFCAIIIDPFSKKKSS